MKTFAVIPVWNEAAALGPVLGELGALPPGIVEHVVVVDAKSVDGSAGVAAAHKAQVVTQQRPGYGAACWQGFRAAAEAGAGIIVFLDGDGSDPPAAIPSLLRPIVDGRADLVLGVRAAVPGHCHPVPWHARAGNALVCLLLWLHTGRRLADLPSMKAIGVDHLQSLQMTEMGYGWTTEMIAKALSRGLRVHQRRVVTRPRSAGVSKVSGRPAASVRAACALIRTAISASRRAAKR